MKNTFKLTIIFIFGLLMSLSLEAVSLKDRPESDLKRDKSSKPSGIINFVGVKSGDQVLDFFGGGGYYTELLSRVVGSTGKVTLHNNQAYLAYVGKALKTRLANNRLTNVEKLMSEADSLQLGTKQYDVIFFVLGYHDLFLVDKNWTVTAEQVMPQLHQSLKTGGKLIIIDHNAAKGAGSTQAKKLHRIEGAFVKRDLTQRGFNLIKTSKLLSNPEDPLNIGVFDPSIRRNTDRFVMLFEKQ